MLLGHRIQCAPRIGTCGRAGQHPGAVGKHERVPAIHDPVPVAQAATLRRLVIAFKAGEHRRAFAPALHVGDPDGVRVSHGVRGTDVLDAALRVEIVAALLLRVRREVAAPWVWLTRAGELDRHDVDADWLAAARAAYAEAGVPLAMVVVTRSGWVDPRSGTLRRWRRLRQR
jgi:hypothetical protein